MYTRGTLWLTRGAVRYTRGTVWYRDKGKEFGENLHLFTLIGMMLAEMFMKTNFNKMF